MDAVGPVQNAPSVLNSAQVDVAEMQQQMRQDVQLRVVEAQTVMETTTATIKAITELYEAQSKSVTDAGKSAEKASQA